MDISMLARLIESAKIAVERNDKQAALSVLSTASFMLSQSTNTMCEKREKRVLNG